MSVSILLVDDEKEFTEYLSKRLSLKGFNITVANSGEEALEIFEREKFDVVILDVLMPGMDGNETLEKIKNSDGDAEVVMLTGHGTVDSAVKGLKKGAFDYLLKPCDLETMVETVKKAAEAKAERCQKEMEDHIAMAILSHGKPRG